MTPETVGPLSRPMAVDRLPSEGTEVHVVATPQEREALARDFGLPAIGSLEGRFKVTGATHRIQVRGRVTAAVTQTCGVTLDPFDAVLDEEVEVDFTAPDALPSSIADHLEGVPTQDEIVNGRIDLGSLTAEFLALGLDPYPRKPGAEFRQDEAGAASDSPFQTLKRLTSGE